MSVDILNDMKFIRPTKDDIPTFLEYYDVFFKNNKWSVSRFSIINAIAEEEFYYSIYDGMFFFWKIVVYKRKKGASMTLYIPPIDKNQDSEKELKYINLMSNIGINTILSEEDIDRYGLDKKDYKEIATFTEYIADSELLCSLEGKTFKKLRYTYNKYIKSDFATLFTHDKINKSMFIDVVSLVKEWVTRHIAKHDRVWSNPVKSISMYNKYQYDNIFQFVAISDNTDLLCYEVTEHINKNQVLSTIGHRSYTKGLEYNFINESILIAGVQNLQHELGHNFLINLGAVGFDNNLKKQKMKYKPIKKLKFYRFTKNKNFLTFLDKVAILSKLRFSNKNTRFKVK